MGRLFHNVMSIKDPPPHLTRTFKVQRHTAKAPDAGMAFEGWSRSGDARGRRNHRMSHGPVDPYGMEATD